MEKEGKKIFKPKVSRLIFPVIAKVINQVRFLVHFRVCQRQNAKANRCQGFEKKFFPFFGKNSGAFFFRVASLDGVECCVKSGLPGNDDRQKSFEVGGRW